MEGIRLSNIALSSPGLAISAASSTLAKTANTVNFKIDGNIYAPLTAANLPNLTGINVATGYTEAITVTVNTAGTMVLTAGSAVLTSSITNGIFPTSSFAAAPAGQSLLGWIIIKNATGSQFTGGTTALDVANLTVTYVNVSGVGAFNNA